MFATIYAYSDAVIVESYSFYTSQVKDVTQATYFLMLPGKQHQATLISNHLTQFNEHLLLTYS